MKKIGLIINPIAGMGGKVGLKGTDGTDILEKARDLGAYPEAPGKALKALEKLVSIKDELLVITCSDDMGENQAKELGFNYKLVYKSESTNTNSHDTQEGAKKISNENVDLILFVGGDGTARDIYESLGNKEVVLGVPGGVKIYSPVYGNTPEKAGELALLYLNGENVNTSEEEVVDIDEEAYRKDVFSTSLYGYLKIPVNKKFMQNKKAPTPLSEEDSQGAIALDIIDNMEKDTYYIIGPGTTPRTIMRSLDLPYTLLGVDILINKKVVGLDLSEKEILEIIKEKPSKLIITPTGGQGYLLGRGNQQISSEVIHSVGKKNIIVIATTSKIIELRGNPFLVYTGDKETDDMLKGYYRVKVGYGMENMYPVNKE